MKPFSFLVIALIICSFIYEATPALSKAALQETKKMMKNICKRSSGVSQELLTKMQNGEFVDDRKLKCYLHCCLGMMKAMKKDQFTVPEATKYAGMMLNEEFKNALVNQLHTCKDEGGTDACDIAYNFCKCCFKMDPDHWLIPT